MWHRQGAGGQGAALISALQGAALITLQGAALITLHIHRSETRRARVEPRFVSSPAGVRVTTA